MIKIKEKIIKKIQKYYNDEYIEKYFKCVCGGHLLEATYYYDSYEFTIWNYNYKGKILSWRERIRWIIRILLTGNPWYDMVILDPKQAEKLSKFLLHHKK